MTDARPIARESVPRVRVAIVRVTPPRRLTRPGHRVRARRAVVVFVFVFIATTAGFSFAADRVAPTIRDPEFGKKLSRLKVRMAASPNRPGIAVFGSSRVGMGVRPPAVETAFGAARRPVVANLSLLGSGPVMQLLAYDRLRRAGVRPAEAVIGE